MRILYWAELFRPAIGGVEVAAAPFLNALRERGHEVAVVACQGPDGLPSRIVVDGVPVFRFPFHEALLSRNLSRVSWLCREIVELKSRLSPDVLHLTTSQPSLLFFERTAEHGPVPAVMTLCEPFAGPSASPLLTRVLRRASWVAAVSESLLADLRGGLPELVERSSAVPYGLPWPEVPDRAAPVDAAEVLLVAGRMVPEKGFDVALRAARILRERRPGIRLVVLGDGPERPRLVELAGELSLGDIVDFRGWLPPEAVPAAMTESTVVVVPSRWKEPFGLVALQAAQVGRPVVASRQGGLAEIVRDGETGLLFTPDDPRDLAAQLERLLSDRALGSRMGAAARTRARELSLERQVRSYEDLYARVRGPADA